MKQTVKKKISSTQKNLSEKIVNTLIIYVKTQLLLIVLVAIASWALLSILGVRFPLLLAILTGTAAVTPVLGLTIAAVIVALVAIFDGVRFLPNLPEITEGFTILILYGLLNVSLDYFLSPYLTGKITKIHPLLLLLAVIFGTAVFGIPGALFAAPVVLVAKTIIDHYKEQKHTK